MQGSLSIGKITCQRLLPWQQPRSEPGHLLGDRRHLQRAAVCLRARARAADEFLIAIVGPLTSLVLAGLFWALDGLAASVGGPLQAVLGYLAFTNLLLGVFNILPGFPLDGGRVLRAIIWGATGSLQRATDVRPA